jgi:hypothetical protein
MRNKNQTTSRPVQSINEQMTNFNFYIHYAQHGGKYDEKRINIEDADTSESITIEYEDIPKMIQKLSRVYNALQIQM